MVLRLVLFLFIIAGLGGMGFVAWTVMNPSVTPQQEAGPAPAPIFVNALTAARSLPVGSALTPEDLAMAPFPPSAVPGGAQIDSAPARLRLDGALVQRALAAGQVITAADLVIAGQHGALATLLLPGKRAATIAVDAVSGGGGLLTPGDHVDVLLTQTRTEPTTPAGHKVSAELVLADLRVVAVDQRLRQGSLADAKDAVVPHTVTLEASDLEVQRLNVAGQLGHLALVIRPALPDTATAPATAAIAATDGLGPVIWSNEASQALGVPAIAPAKTIRVFQGPGEEKEFHY
jgi:pilus assembly protein CpaB